MVSLSMPQVMPANALRILFLLTFASMLVACAAKYKRLSKVNPRIFGYLTVGMVLPSTLTFNIFLTSLVQKGNWRLESRYTEIPVAEKEHQGPRVAGDN